MQISNNPKQNRYELDIDGQLAFADYQQEGGGNLVITHVFVPPELRGQGIAAKLMEFIVADSREKRFTIVPVCPYAAAYMKRQAS